MALKEIFGKNNLILKIAKSELLQSIWEETNRWNRLKWKSSLRHIIKKLKSRLPQVEDAADYIDKLSIGLSDSALSKCKTYVSQQLNKGEKGTISDALGAARPHLELVLVLCLLLKCLDKRSISVKRSSEAKSAILMELIYELAQIESLPNARRLKTSSIKRSMR